MEKIVWNESFCIGITEIDNQNRKIINQINYLIDNLNCDDKACLSGEIIKNLDKYSKEHFATDEDLKKNKFPGF